MIYLDTSVVVALLTREGRSPEALDWFEQCRETLISCDWLITEAHSALGIKQRHHGLSPQARQAAELLQDPALGLRAGDALHLAVALHSRCTQLASFDGRMQQAAKGLGLLPSLDEDPIPLCRRHSCTNSWSEERSPSARSAPIAASAWPA